MSAIELDPVILNNEARKCRRLAATMNSADDIAMLERLAIEYETLASEAERSRSAIGDWRTGRRWRF